ncbi:MAG TPA: AAA family ATPase [Pyrinomonadaceae bacterium]|jgi:adenylate kinase|nr:AAA family ATPase [Pyrinomonadaceae bacterium]
MKIQREKLEIAFSEFATKSGGIVIGSPGVGKTYLLKNFSDKAEVKFSIIPLYLPIDKLGVENDAQLRAALNIEENFIDYLKKHDSKNPSKKILIIDAFDAARSEVSKRYFLNLIKQVLKNLQETWNVVVSVRTYDATKSQELQDIFPRDYSNTPSQEFQTFAISCQHFVIPPLNDDERQQAVNSILHLPRLFESGSIDFKELLRIPFHLWLAETILRINPNLEELSSVNSEIQLLGYFWKYRIKNDISAEDLLGSLSKITRAMVTAKSLSIRKDEIYEIGIQQIWDALMASEVIVYTSTDEQRITFRHNILFDYAVSILLIEDNLQEFVNFINSDPSRPLFLRPSLNYYFTRLWYANPELFWTIFWGVLPNDSLHVRLFARLLPPTVIVNEARQISELQPLVEALTSGEDLAKEAVLRVLQAYRMIRPMDARAGIWFLFLLAISQHLSHKFAWDLAILTNEFIDIVQSYKNSDALNICGEIARRLLNWIWLNRLEGDKAWFDNLGYVWAIPMVAKTYETDIESSRLLLRKVFELLAEPGFPINYFYRLADHIEYVWDYSPDLVEDIYLNVFTHQESSEEKTQFGTAVVPMTSTRRQDFEMCQYVLTQKTSAYVKAKPRSAAMTILRLLNPAIINERLLRYEIATKEELPISEFLFRGGQAKYLADRSYFWDGSYREGPIELAGRLFSFIDGIASTKERIDDLERVLDVFRDFAIVAFFWKRLIESGTRSPEFFSSYLIELCIAPPVLRGPDTSPVIEEFIAAAWPDFSESQRLELENSIMTSIKSPDEDDEDLIYWKKRMIVRIPATLLQTEEGKNLKKEMEQKGDVPAPRAPRGFSFSSTPLTEEMWLEDEGVDLSKTQNNILLKSSAPLASFSSKWLNEIASSEEIVNILEKAKETFSLIKENDSADHQVLETAWTHLGSCASAMSHGITDKDSEEFRFCKEILLICSKHPSPVASAEEDETYTSAAWSSAPRTEAAQGLPWLAVQGPDDEIFEAIELLINDPKPSIRFLIVSELFRLIYNLPDKFWKFAEYIADHEKNKVVQEAFFRTLSYIAIKDEKHTVAIMDRFFKNRWSDFKEIQIWDTAMPTIVGLALARENTWCIQTIDMFLTDPIEKISPLHSAVFNALSFVRPERFSDPKNLPATDRAIQWLKKVISILSVNIRESLTASPNMQRDEYEKKVYRLYKVVDDLVLRLYFAAKIKDEHLQENEEQITELQREQYYFKIKPLLNEILVFATDKNQGLFAPTAYHFMQLLRGVLKYDPKDVLNMAANVARSSESSGYLFDSMAIRQVIEMVELVLADYRYEVREGRPLEDLMTLLDFFANTGAAEALRLVWKLDEIYR